MTTCAAALKTWEASNDGASAGEATEINLCLQHPPIAKLDTKVLGSLKKCEKLSLSTNMIDRSKQLIVLLYFCLNYVLTQVSSRLPQW